MRAAADAAAELVELAEAELVGLVDDDGVHVRDVEAGLDDRGADEDVRPAVREVVHDVGQLVLVHLAVADARRALPGTMSCSFRAIRSMLWTRLCTK